MSKVISIYENLKCKTSHYYKCTREENPTKAQFYELPKFIYRTQSRLGWVIHWTPWVLQLTPQVIQWAWLTLWTHFCKSGTSPNFPLRTEWYSQNPAMEEESRSSKSGPHLDPTSLWNPRNNITLKPFRKEPSINNAGLNTISLTTNNYVTCHRNFQLPDTKYSQSGNLNISIFRRWKYHTWYVKPCSKT